MILSVQSEAEPRRRSIARNRWIVHLALIAGFVAVLLSAIELSKKYLGHSGVTDHSIIGVVVLGFVVVHLFQRRHTVARLSARLAGLRKSTETRTRLAVSDAILWLLTLNVMVSGFFDFVDGHTILLPVPGPDRFRKWHAMAALVLVVYVIVHVLRRRTRLRTSRIR